MKSYMLALTKFGEIKEYDSIYPLDSMLQIMWIWYSRDTIHNGR